MVMDRQNDEQVSAGEDAGEAEVEGHRASLPDRMNHPHSARDVSLGGASLQGDRAVEPQQRQGQEAPWAAEVAGHGEVSDPGMDDPTDADVAGHMHPYLSEKVATARYQDHLAEAERNRKASEAEAGSPGSGILDKLRRRGER
jgi:hypothetical protein